MAEAERYEILVIGSGEARQAPDVELGLSPSSWPKAVREAN